VTHRDDHVAGRAEHAWFLVHVDDVHVDDVHVDEVWRRN
jgi:hypothetical protein